jgi:hypothetical protein
MNLRYVIALVGLLLFAIAQITGEGGAIDSTLPGHQRAVESGPTPAATPSPRAAALFAYDDRPVAGIGDRPLVGSDVAASPRVETVGFTAAPARTFPQNASVGALSKEQLGVEEPSGLAVARQSGR